MNTKYARLVAGVALAGSLGVACSDPANNDGAAGTTNRTPSTTISPSASTSAPADGVDGTATAAADLRAGLTALLQEHVYLAGITTGTALDKNAGPKSAAYKAAAATLDANSQDLAKAIGSVYGDAAGKQFLDLWRKHIGFFVDYTLGAAGNDKAMQAKAVKELDGYRADFGAFLESANPELSKQAVADELKPHVASLAAAVDAQAAGRPNAFAKLQQSAAHMPQTASILAGGIAKQKMLEGTVDGGGSNLRSLLTAQLQEHVYLAGLATGTALDMRQGPKSQSFAAAAKTLDDNSVALSKSISSVYGDAAGKQFLDLWRKHIGFFVDYTLGAAGKDKAMQAKAVKDLDGYRADFGAFLAAANPNVTKQAIADDLKVHVETLAGAVQAQADGDPAAFDKLRAAASHMPMTAATLAGAIAKQFPDKFAA